MTQLMTEYIVRRIGSPNEATILKDGEAIGSIREKDHDNDGGNLSSIIRTNSSKSNSHDRIFLTTQWVDGKINPFSIAIYEEKEEIG